MSSHVSQSLAAAVSSSHKEGIEVTSQPAATTFRRKKELEAGQPVQRPEATDRSVEMAATTSRTSVDISKETQQWREAEVAASMVEREDEEEEEEERREATTESVPVTMSVEAPPRDQLGRRKNGIHICTRTYTLYTCTVRPPLYS